MTDDLIIFVPPGTRVRYAESPFVDEVYAVDASQLGPAPVRYPQPDPPAGWDALPLHKAERYEEDS